MKLNEAGNSNLKSTPVVNFVCIGAAKSGTTWLYQNLKQHPNIVVSNVKEIYYFNKYSSEEQNEINPHYGKSLNWYHSFFPSRISSEERLGEFSTTYLKYQNCSTDIYRYNPQMKIIAILRNPTEQVYSQYLFFIQKGFIPVYWTFEETLLKRPYLLKNALYFQQLKPYFDLFPKDQIKILWYEDIKNRSEQLYSETLDFLGLHPFISPYLNTLVNPTIKVKSKKLNSLLISFTERIRSKNVPLFLRYIIDLLKLRYAINKIHALNLTEFKDKKPEIKSSTKQMMANFFQHDINSLEKILGKDLKTWKYEA